MCTMIISMNRQDIYLSFHSQPYNVLKNVTFLSPPWRPLNVHLSNFNVQYVTMLSRRTELWVAIGQLAMYIPWNFQPLRFMEEYLIIGPALLPEMCPVQFSSVMDMSNQNGMDVRLWRTKVSTLMPALLW